MAKQTKHVRWQEYGTTGISDTNDKTYCGRPIYNLNTISYRAADSRDRGTLCRSCVKAMNAQAAKYR